MSNVDLSVFIPQKLIILWQVIELILNTENKQMTFIEYINSFTVKDIIKKNKKFTYPITDEQINITYMLLIDKYLQKLFI